MKNQTEIVLSYDLAELDGLAQRAKEIDGMAECDISFSVSESTDVYLARVAAFALCQNLGLKLLANGEAFSANGHSLGDNETSGVFVAIHY